MPWFGSWLVIQGKLATELSARKAFPSAMYYFSVSFALRPNSCVKRWPVGGIRNRYGPANSTLENTFHAVTLPSTSSSPSRLPLPSLLAEEYPRGRASSDRKQERTHSTFYNDISTKACSVITLFRTLSDRRLSCHPVFSSSSEGTFNFTSL